MGGTLWMRIVCMAGLFEFFQFDGGAAVLGAAFLGTVVGNGLVGSLAHAFDALGRGTQFDHVFFEGLSALLSVFHVGLARTGVVSVAEDGDGEILVGLQGLADGVDGTVGNVVEFGFGARDGKIKRNETYRR